MPALFHKLPVVLAILTMLVLPLNATAGLASALGAPPTAGTPAQAGPPAQPEDYRKAIARSDRLDPVPEGMTLWHDYGAFALYKVPATTVDRLSVDTRRKIEMPADMNDLLIDAYPFNTQRDTFASIPDHLRVTQPEGPALHLIQFVGPIKQAWLRAVEKAGAVPIHYIANYGYLVWADGGARTRLDRMAQAKDFLQFSAPHQPYFKIGTSLRERLNEVDRKNDSHREKLVRVTIQMYDHPGKKSTEALIADLAHEQLSPWTPILDYQNATAMVETADVATLAAQPDVLWIGAYGARERFDEVQNQILAGNFDAAQSGPSGPGYLDWLAGYNLSTDPADYPIVDVTDDGIGNGTVEAGDPTLHELGDPANPSRLQYVGNCTAEANGGGPDGHGHLNVSIVGGYDVNTSFPYLDPDGFNRGLGVSPYGRIAGTRVFGPSGFDLSNCGSTDTGLIKQVQDSGAQIASNSWGCGDCAGTYDAASQTFDAGVRDADPTEPGNQPMIFIFAAGNDGNTTGTIGTPANGKNMITVGASESDRPSDEDGSWTDGCLISPTGANHAMDVIGFSSRGPAPGGRVKPEVIAPGTHIQGTASTHPLYNGSGVCDLYHPSNQTVFAASSGTSHSTPAVAGVSSLYYYWMEDRYGLTPSPALMKAYLIAHPTYLTGLDANDDLPSNNQGYGMPNLTLGFDDAKRKLIDQTHRFDDTGETWTYRAHVADPGRPVRIVLAYTDEPGAIGTSPEVNDLNLAVAVDGGTYLGNHFSGQWSVTGGTADADNNYEAVFLPAGTKGWIEVTVTAFNIAGDGVPNTGDGTDQDFALVAYNVSQEPLGVLAGIVYEDGGTPETDPVTGATVRAASGATRTFTTTTDVSGLYAMPVPSATYTLDVQTYGYHPAQISGVSVVSGTTTTRDIPIMASAFYTIAGTVTDAGTGDPLWARLDIQGNPFDPPTTTLETEPATGHYHVALAENVTHTIEVAAPLHVPATTVLAPLTGDATLDFNLSATTLKGIIAGWVRDDATGDPLNGATVTVKGVITPATTGSDGYFETVPIGAGPYTSTASADMYGSVTLTDVEVITSNVTLVAFRLPTAHLEVEPGALSATLQLGAQFTQTPGLVISNTGEGGLDFELREETEGTGEIPWLTEDPISGTVASGSAQDVDVGWWANVDQPGAYHAGLRILTNDPHHPDVVLPVTMTVTPPPTWGNLRGSITTAGYCDNAPAPLGNARIEIENGTAISTTTDGDGTYALWLEAGTYTATVSAAGHLSDTRAVTITAGNTITHDRVLRRLQPCLSVAPPALNATLDMGLSTTLPLTFSNSGAAPLTFDLEERWARQRVLVVDDDSGSTYDARPYVEAALTALNIPYDVFDTGGGDGPPVAQMVDYPTILWVSGDTFGGNAGPTSTDELSLTTYLEGGGTLFLSSQDYYYDMGLTSFMETYLGVTSVDNDVGHTSITGIQGDPIGDEFGTLTLSYPGNNYSDILVPDGTASAAFSGSAGHDAGLHKALTYKTVFFAFPWEALQDHDPAHGEAVLRAVLNWLATTDIPWLSAAPVAGTVAPDGGRATLNVTLDALTVAQPGDYDAVLTVVSDDPNRSRVSIPVTMTVTQPETWAKIQGTVHSLGHCDADPAPLANADVRIESTTPVSTTTHLSGTYTLWLEPGTYTMTVSADEHVSDQGIISVTGETTTTRDVSLRWRQPCVSVSPPSLSATLTPGVTATLPLSIHNRGALSTPFSVSESEEIRALSGSTCRRCGESDSFGYSYQDSGDVGGPAYDFVDISTTGPAVSLGDDDYAGPFDLGFAFDFYGNEQRQYYLGSNGFLSFEEGSDAWLNDCPLPSPSAPNNIVAIHWDDLSPNAGGAIYHRTFDSCPYGSGACEIVMFDGVPYYSGESSGVFEVILFENDNLLMQYQDPGDASGLGATTGLENGDGTVGLTYGACDSPNLSTELAICFAHPGNPTDCTPGDVPWLSETPTAGTVDREATSAIDVTFDPLTYTTGTYTATLRVDTQDPVFPTLAIPITMTIQDPICRDVILQTLSHDRPVLAGTATHFTATVSGQTPITYTWDFDSDGAPDQMGIELATVAHTFGVTGTYTTTLTAENGCPSSDVRSIQVAVSEARYLYLPLVMRDNAE